MFLVLRITNLNQAYLWGCILKKNEAKREYIENALDHSKYYYIHSVILFCCRYAPALRQLRQVAFLVTFPPTFPARLATRLSEVIRGHFLSWCLMPFISAWVLFC